MSDNAERGALQQGPSSGLVFSYDYHPGLPFQVVSSFQQPTVANILGGDQGVVSDPADYNGYIIRYQIGGGGIYALVFIRDQSLQQGTTYHFSGNVSFFNNQINLLSAALAVTEGDGQETTGEGATDEETTGEGATDEETTTTETTTTTSEDEEADAAEAVNVETTTEEGG